MLSYAHLIIPLFILAYICPFTANVLCFIIFLLLLLLLFLFPFVHSPLLLRDRSRMSVAWLMWAKTRDVTRHSEDTKWYKAPYFATVSTDLAELPPHAITQCVPEICIRFSCVLFGCGYIIRPWWICMTHDDVIKWKHFPRYWPFVRGIHRSPVNSPHKGQCRAALMFSLICAWINGWVNDGEAGDLRRHRTHYDVTVMCLHLYSSWLIH